MATVVLLGTLDTKGEEYDFLRLRVRKEGVDALLVDTGVLGVPLAEPDISREEVAEAAGADAQELAKSGDRGAAVEAMARGAAEIVKELHAQGRLDAVLALGGSGGTAIATHAMRELPVGVPKLMVSTMASGDTRAVRRSGRRHADVLGRRHCGTEPDLGAHPRERCSSRRRDGEGRRAAGRSAEKPLVGATMFGVTTPSVTEARKRLEELGYEVLVFHATGTGGQAMEALIRSGFITASLDVTTTELADELVGGVLSAGPERLEAAGELGIPQVVSLGALDMVNFGPFETVPPSFAIGSCTSTIRPLRSCAPRPRSARSSGRVIAAEAEPGAGAADALRAAQGRLTHRHGGPGLPRSSRRRGSVRRPP